MPDQYVQFGCGTTAPDSFRNFDAGPAFWIQKHLPFLTGVLARRGYPVYPPNIEYCDVIKGFPVVPATVKAVYCSHVLEHLTLDEFRAVLRNTYAVLQPGGTFRFVLPDLEYFARCYLESTEPEAAGEFMRNTYLGTESKGEGLRRILRDNFGRSRHFWMWDEKSMAHELAAAGFSGIRRAYFGDNPDLHFTAVEEEDRWTNMLGMECTRPA